MLLQWRCSQLVLTATMAAVLASPANGQISTETPPDYVGPPTAAQATDNRAFTGIPSMAISPGGRLWATWYAGVTPGEDRNNYVVLTTSGDGGKTWKELLVVDPDGPGPRRAFDPQLWIAPDGKLRWSWTDGISTPETHRLWMMTFADPDSELSPRTSPVCITKGVMMGKPIVLSTGEWALPVSTWQSSNSSKMVVSTDGGKTWSVRGGANQPKKSRTFDEHSLVERKDGSLWLLARTTYGIGESVSTDRGATWSELKPSPLKHTSSRFFVRRLASGNLLLVKHGPLDKVTGRSHLTAYLSKDDGRTWQGGLLLDERGGDPKAKYANGISYPDGQQDKNGLIHIIYDYDRMGDREILMATFREEDVLAGRADSPSVHLRQLVSKGSGGREKKSPAK